MFSMLRLILLVAGLALLIPQDGKTATPEEIKQWEACEGPQDCALTRDACGEWDAVNKEFQEPYAKHIAETAPSVECMPHIETPVPKIDCVNNACQAKPL